MSKIYAMRWSNGTFGLVGASGKVAVCKRLDEWGPANPEDLIEVGDFGIDFTLNDDGTFTANFTDDPCGMAVYAMFPVLSAALCDVEPGDPRGTVGTAVRHERKRVNNPQPSAKTAVGRELQDSHQMSATVADNYD